MKSATPEAKLVAGKELDRLMAIEVMGYKPSGSHTIDGLDVYANGVWLNQWHPSTDIKHALVLIDEMKRRHGAFNPIRLTMTLKGWCCRVRLGYLYGQCFDAIAETPSLAICAAILKASRAAGKV